MVNRLGVFFIVSANETIEKYVFFLLDRIKKDVSELIIVLKEGMKKEDIAKVSQYSDHLICVLNDDLSWDTKNDRGKLHDLLKRADEIILMNDSCYGPFYPLDEVWKTMESQDLDYWGITGQVNNGPRVSGELLYIHSYFMAISKRLYCSDEFSCFIDKVKAQKNIDEAMEYIEKSFHWYFAECGFKGNVYINDEAVDLDEGDISDNLEFDSYRMISEYNCPFIKKGSIINKHENVLKTNSGETAKRTLNYITQNTSYDEKLIWFDLIHNNDVGKIRTALHLDYIFQTKGKPSDKSIIREAAIVVHINYTELIDYCLSYVARVSDYIDVFIVSKGEKNIEIIMRKIENMKKTNVKIVASKDCESEIGTLLTTCKDILADYKYLCFVHDKENDADQSHQTVRQSSLDILWENTVKNNIYIENVLNQFEKEPRLGLLVPPAPYMAMSLTSGVNDWITYYEGMRDLVNRLNLNCCMDKENTSSILGRAFWCRTDALQPLFESGIFDKKSIPMTGTVNPVIERILPYVAQSKGYYSGVMMTDEYISIYTSNFQYMLYGVLGKMLYNEGIEQYFDIHNMKQMIADFCNKYKNFYIYGAGVCGKACLSHVLKHEGVNVLGFIVSDGHKNQNNLYGFPVYELSEIKPQQTEGIMVALNRSNMSEVMHELNGRGFVNIGKYLEDSL